MQLSSGSKQQAMKEAVTSYLNKSKPRNQQAFKIKKVSPTPEIKAGNDSEEIGKAINFKNKRIKPLAAKVAKNKITTMRNVYKSPN